MASRWSQRQIVAPEISAAMLRSMTWRRSSLRLSRDRGRPRSEGNGRDADDDNDDILHGSDNCSLDFDPGQEDLDQDGVGDFCDTDDDEEGIQDDVDECAYASMGDVVGENGCSIDQLCPSAHPDCSDWWKSYGAYVSCVAHTSEVFVGLGLLTEEEKDAIVSEAGQSTSGAKK